MNNEKKITRKQKLFCEYYISELNANTAYAKAYSKDEKEETCRVNACKLLKKQEIQDYIKQLMDEQKDNEIVAGPSEILMFLTSVMRGQEKDQFDLDAPLKERNKAAELLARKYGMFNDKVKIDAPIPVIITGENELEE